MPICDYFRKQIVIESTKRTRLDATHGTYVLNDLTEMPSLDQTESVSSYTINVRANSDVGGKEHKPRWSTYLTKGQPFSEVMVHTGDGFQVIIYTFIKFASFVSK
jgi:hypothetical protein